VAKEKTALETFRTRWRRWLGNKARVDAPYWTTLLDSNWLGWVDRVFTDAGLDYHGITHLSSREEVKATYAKAIDHATMEHLYKLDGLYANEKLEALR
jgi:hypothetical protein